MQDFTLPLLAFLALPLVLLYCWRFTTDKRAAHNEDTNPRIAGLNQLPIRFLTLCIGPVAIVLLAFVLPLIAMFAPIYRDRDGRATFNKKSKCGETTEYTNVNSPAPAVRPAAPKPATKADVARAGLSYIQRYKGIDVQGVRVFLGSDMLAAFMAGAQYQQEQAENSRPFNPSDLKASS